MAEGCSSGRTCNGRWKLVSHGHKDYARVGVESPVAVFTSMLTPMKQCDRIQRALRAGEMTRNARWTRGNHRNLGGMQTRGTAPNIRGQYFGSPPLSPGGDRCSDLNLRCQ